MLTARRPRAPLLTLLATLAVAAAPAPTVAQVSPADSAAVLLETAGTFRDRGQGEVAEQLYRLIIERYGATPAAPLARERLAELQTEVLYGSGRVELQVWSTLYGAWLGIAIPGALGSNDLEAYGTGLLLGAPAGFFAGRGLANALQLTEGQARAITLGGSWGTWQGYGWREVFELGTGETCEPNPFGDDGEYCYEPEDSWEEAFAAMVIGGLTGIAAGALLSGRDITPGTGTAANFGSLWGTWLGFAAGVLSGLEDDALLGSTLIGGDVGLASMAVLAPRWSVNRNRARLVSVAGLIGGLAGGGLDLIIQPEDEKAAVAIPLAGSVIGLVIGAWSTRSDRAPGAGGPGLGANGALFGLRDGRFDLGIPVPLPRLLAPTRPSDTRWRPALGVEIFRATF